jgi:uncharacterized membrane protein
MEQGDDADQASGRSPESPKNRIEALTDGIFAIAMTLLVLSLDVPAGVNNPSNAAIMAMLTDLGPDFYHYFLAFFMLPSG